MKVAVTNIIHRNDTGTIFSGRIETGNAIMVKAFESIPPVIGAVYELQAQPYMTENKWGRK